MTTELTEAQADGLRVARQMIDAGIPVFAAAPCPGAECKREGHSTGKYEYDLPPKWQLTVPSHVWLERWRPGWALGAVGGTVADFLDEDPRHGGEASIAELTTAGHMPRVFGVQGTPSGGRHYVISLLHEAETNGFMPGLDYQGGKEDGKGRAFVWLAPTVRKSKVQPYERLPYVWLQEPDMDYLKDFDSDDSVEGLRDRILAKRTTSPASDRDNQRLKTRLFTEEEARKFCGITLERLEAAPRGEIENYANDAACQLSHFVPEFWSVEFAYNVLLHSLSKTEYDPTHPASAWDANKFLKVVSGENGRAPMDWEAERKPEHVEEVVPEESAVDALLREMLSPKEIMEREPPRALIKGFLNLDSESWMIGKAGSKKSFVATDMVGHVANGMDWQGFKTTQGTVVMIVAEGVGGFGKRLKAWEKEHGRSLGEEVRILPRPVQAKNLGGWAVLVETCRRLQPVLIVLDTQARITVGLEENSATDMGLFVEAVRALREATGACVLTVHHTGRRGGDARGSSALDGAQYTELTVEEGKSRLQGVLKSTKQKDLDEADDLPLIFKVVTVGQEGDGTDITSLVLTADAYERAAGEEEPAPVPDWIKYVLPNQEAIMEAIREHTPADGSTRAQIRGWVKEHREFRHHPVISQGSIDSALKALVKKDELMKVGSKYVLTELPD